MGCNFCATSSFFGGKGKFANFYETGDELFEVMSHMESALKVQTFFVMDENFLLHRERAMQLLRRMKKAGKSWGMAVFASANAIRKYTFQELIDLGISWLWMGLESPHSHYSKLQGTDTRQLTRELREHGIRVQGSTIIGLEHHTRENIGGEIEYAVSHHTDFHQFMLYTRRCPARLFSRKCRSRAAGLAPLQGLSGPAGPRTLRARGGQAAYRLQRRPLGHGEAVP